MFSVTALLLSVNEFNEWSSNNLLIFFKLKLTFFRQSYDVQIDIIVNGILHSNILDLKCPYFRYNGITNNLCISQNGK